MFEYLWGTTMSKQIVIVGIIVCLFSISPNQVISSVSVNYEYQTARISSWGPFLDRIVYNIIENEQDQVSALVNDEIDIIGHPVNLSYFDGVIGVEDISLESTTANSYMAFIFNCAKYPFNITAFRRAFAYALDKEAMAELWISGSRTFARPMDSCIPPQNPLSAEKDLEFSYTISDMEKANSLLNNAGFMNLDSDEYRKNPDGSNLDISLEYFSNCSAVQYTLAMAMSIFDDLGINVTCVFNNAGFGWIDSSSGKVVNDNFDIGYTKIDLRNLDAEWLGYEYWSENANKPGYNKAHFQNTTYDSFRDSLLHSINYSEVSYAAKKMQKIIAYECPIVVSHEILNTYAYRTDKFENHLNEMIYGATGRYSLCKVQLKAIEGGPYGGAYRIGIGEDIHSFNLFKSESIESGQILSLLYDSLLTRDSNGTVRSLLAIDWVLETHNDNEKVARGNTRMTFKIDPTAVWTDGIPCTAHDVAFSINYYLELENHWLHDAVSNVIAAYTNGDYVIVEFNSESYWHLNTVGFLPIIPKHSFQDISVEDCFEYEPKPPETPMVTMGPFNVSERVTDEFITLIADFSYYHLDPYETQIRITNGTIYEGFNPTSFYHMFDPPANIILSGCVYEVVWYVNGAIGGYTIHVDDEITKVSSKADHVSFEPKSSGPLVFQAGLHTISISVNDFFGKNYTNVVEVFVHDTVLLALGISSLAATGVIACGIVIMGFYDRRKIKDISYRKSRDSKMVFNVHKESEYR